MDPAALLRGYPDKRSTPLKRSIVNHVNLNEKVLISTPDERPPFLKRPHYFKVQKRWAFKRGSTVNKITSSESRPVIVAHTVVDVRAVVVKLLDASVTDTAVFGADGLHRSTCVTQMGQRVPTVLPLIIVRHLVIKMENT